jgi:hypothetical protein
MHDSERCSIYGTRVTESQLMIASLSRSYSQKQLQRVITGRGIRERATMATSLDLIAEKDI